MPDKLPEGALGILYLDPRSWVKSIRNSLPDDFFGIPLMATQSLLQYLSVSLPAILTQGTVPSRNTTNSHYNTDDITQVVAWPEFNYTTIIQQYGPVLNKKQIWPEPLASPPAAIRDEPQFHLYFTELVLS